MTCISSGSLFHHLDMIGGLAWALCCQTTIKAEHVGYHGLVFVSDDFIELGLVLVSGGFSNL